MAPNTACVMIPLRFEKNVLYTLKITEDNGQVNSETYKFHVYTIPLLEIEGKTGIKTTV